MIKKIAILWIVSIVTFIVVSCSLQQSEIPVGVEQANSMASVEVDVFSGQPNPIWELTEAQSTELGTLIATLPESESGMAFSEALGFRGFIVHDLKLDGGDATVRIKDEMVFVNVETDDQRETYYYDEDKVVFNTLKTMSGTQLPSDLYESIFANND